ncbi:probable plastid-lipid-associated protein 13, chloroplastic isoform X2 [Olea europaea var. sylvestris]|uniref:probable plastid-lipid-associated protein 13, chloroplastic isoform X2 n=1 Tax=Olea europaea var. sylvestris TaxID=158386 RepID=UPI000C1D667F|nr:probable plastid-lipid-associated protein 13, chloroplastic isoform X2 [Olea europaea var. sylvestris]
MPRPLPQTEMRVGATDYESVSLSSLLILCHLLSLSTVLFLQSNGNDKYGNRKRKVIKRCRGMVQHLVKGRPSAAYAREMERLSAKESLLRAFKDAGGFEALIAGKTTEMQCIDVNERIVSLERLNSTLRPTTSPYLEGQWKCEWLGSGSPGRFPPTLANLSNLDTVIKDEYANIAANIKLLNLIQSNFILSARLSIEGPRRMKVEYVEGIFESPKIYEESIPQQLKSVLVQAASTVQQLPVSIRDAIVSGVRIPLGGTFQRLFLISYLDEDILITRDTAGVPEVFRRLDSAPLPMIDGITEFES